MTSSKPITFKDFEVRAVLAGTKTMTRRVLKPQPPANVTSAGVISTSKNGQTDQWSWLSGDPKDCDTWMIEGDFKTTVVPGQHLWVREAFYLTDNGDEQCAVYAADERAVAMHMNFIGQIAGTLGLGDEWVKPHVRLRPSIHMPRWASRITLEVTDVRVQRLQDISGEDAVREGMDSHGPNRPQDDFRALWNSIHGPDAWDRNDWVAAYSFRMVG